MRFRDLALLLGAGSAATLLYGLLVESKRLVLERHTLNLPYWPERLSGFRIAVLGDFHVRDEWSLKVACRAVSMALDEQPDMVVIVGDFVGYWKPQSVEMLTQILEPLLLMEGNVVAVPGNHDYPEEGLHVLAMLLSELNIKLLRNQAWEHAGVTWVGIDSARERKHQPMEAMSQVKHKPAIALWHEPDLVDRLPGGAVLQISGHSHGGQFRFPFGITPMHSELGIKYPRGFYTDTRTPLYVTRGVGTTGPPSRFLCPPEVSLLTLVPA